MGISVHHPRFLSFPGLFKRFDGISMALSCYPCVRRIKQRRGFDIIDSHFAYPDGYAATLLGRWLGCPVTITLRGTEARLLGDATLGSRVMTAVNRATRVFSVAGSLVEAIVAAGGARERCQVIGNGVDTEKFRPIDASHARALLGLENAGPILVSVGGLVERKGFHRVIDVLPSICERWPGLKFLIVGSGGPEGDMEGQLRQQVSSLGLAHCVEFLGALPSESLHVPLSAANVFVLATRNEGWANVFLEAMACGLPVVTTDVGGNAEVVSDPSLGRLVAFDDSTALERAIDDALGHHWDRAQIRAHAEANHWDTRVDMLVAALRKIVAA